jgi:hypothetical protein
LIQKFISDQKSKERQTSREIPLQTQKFAEAMQEKYKWWQSLEKALTQSTHLFTVENTSYDNQVLNMDAFNQDINMASRKNIGEDIYIEETYLIVSDMISTLESK